MFTSFRLPLHFLLLLWLSFPLSTFAQSSDTLFFTSDWTPTDRRMPDGYFGVKNYNGIGVGEARFYYGTGELHHRQDEKDNVRHGQYEEYGKLGHINSSAEYHEGQLVEGTLMYHDHEAPPELIIVTPPPAPADPETVDGEEQILEFPEVESQFPGGLEALQQFITDNVRYPQESLITGEQGKVFMSFVVEPDGSLSTITVERSVSPELDKEAKRLIAIMPRWKPAEVAGKPVRCRVRLPINFTLNDPVEEEIQEVEHSDGPVTEDVEELDSDEAAIRACWDSYRFALLLKRGEEVADLLSDNMMEYYKTMLFRTRYLERRELEALPVLDQLGIVLLRIKMSKKQMLTFDERDLLIFAVKEEMFSTIGTVIEFKRIDVRESDATAHMLVPGSEEELIFDFHLEDGSWKIDLTQLLEFAQMAVEDLLKQTGQTRADFVELAVTNYLHKRPSPKVWNAPLKK